MQRRSFINASMWSVLGCTVLPGAVVDRSYHTTDEGIFGLLGKLGFRKQHIFSIDHSLLQCSEEHLIPWRNSGYTPKASGMFWMATADYAIVPVQQSQTEIGVLDYGTLHFGKSANGEWTYCGALSGFQIEAIHRALKLEDLKNVDSAYHRDLFLPVASADDFTLQVGKYLTALGSFHVNARITPNYTLIKAQLVKSGTTIWEDEYQSEHLRSKVLADTFS